MNAKTKSVIPEFLAGGGEMGERIRTFDWSQTPLGIPEDWHQSLKTCVRIMLTCPQPMFVWWGEELINIYNDAYIQVIGDKHPIGLGQNAKKVWEEIWDEIGARCDIVMQQNRGTFDDALLLLMNRYGYNEETYFKFSYSPIPGDKGPTGIFCACTEETERILGERQLNTLQDLSKALSETKTIEEVYEHTIETLKQNGKDFPFAIIYKLSEDGQQLSRVGITSDKLQNIFPSELDIFSHASKFHGLGAAIATNKPVIVDDLAERFVDLPSGSWNKSPTKAIIIPVFHHSQKVPFAILKMGINPFRLLDEKYQRFFQLVADQVAIALSNVHAFQEERRRIEALEEIDKAKTVFFSNISHEFRTPLTLMLGPLEELINTPQNNISANEKKNLETTHRNALRLLKLVNTLLDFSRIESGRQKANFQLTDIGTFTNNLASCFRSVIENAGLNFLIETNNFNQPMYVDRQMWEKIVFNLLSNAFKYTLEGTISVSIEGDIDHAVLKVADTGVGIPEKELPKMFERFHRVPQITGRTYEGSGIGLSLVKELVRLHGGTISVESREGQGSTFTVTIPYGKDHVDTSQITESEEDPAGVMANLYVEESVTMLDTVSTESKMSTITDLKSDLPESILVVDDNADLRQHIQMILDKKYEVITAINGLDALNKIKEKIPSLVLSDIMMPTMDGIQLLRELKRNEATEHIPVIFLTARAGEESRIEGFETGADDYLVKPFSAKELLARVTAQIRVLKIRQKIEESEERFRTMASEAPIFVWVTDENLQTTYINHTGLDYFNLDHNIKMTDLSWKQFIHPEDIDTVLSVMRNAAKYKQPYTLEMRLKNGVTGEYRWFVDKGAPRYANKQFIGFIGTSFDIHDRREAEIAIKDNEERFRALTKATTSIVWTTGPDGSFVTPQYSWEIYTGQEWHEHKDYGWTLAIHENDRENVKRLWKEALEKKKEYHSTGRIWSAKYASYRYFEASGVPLKNQLNEISEWVGMVTDVHEKVLARKKFEDLSAELELKVNQRTAELEKKNRELEESESFLQQLIDSSVEYVSVLDNGLKYVTVNKRFEEAMKTSRREVFGKHILEISPKAKGTIQFNCILRALKGEITHLENIQSVAIPEIYVDTYFVPWYVQNKIAGAIIMARDVTDIIRSELQLKNANDQLKSSLQILQHAERSANIGNWQWNLETNSLDWSDNLYKIFGYERNEMQPSFENLLTLIHPDDKEKVLQSNKAAMENREPSEDIFRIVTKDGSIKLIKGIGSKITIDNVDYIIGTSQDITTANEAAEEIKEINLALELKNIELERINKELESYTYVASHDLQEPLRKIQTFIELIQRNRDDLGPSATYFNKIKSAAQRMSQLIQSLLAYSKLTYIDEPIQSTNLNAVFKNVSADLELLIREKNATIKCDKLPIIMAVPFQMNQLFSNLINNSLKFSGKRPIIRITSKIIDSEKLKAKANLNLNLNYVKLTFKDNGIGFEPQYNEHIFKLFQRLHGKHEYSGTGVGLSIVKRIVEHHNGFIKAAGKPGVGTKVTIYLPV
jgi:PAS domain S-box-containing protein